MPNVFDQFDQAQTANPFDQFDANPVQKSGKPPTVMQTIAASPIGSFVHDALMQPIAGLAGMLAKADPTGSMVAPMQAKSENSYQAALAAQQNRPGYAQALQTAQGVAAQRPTGLTDQFIAQLTPTLAGTAGFVTGGLNGMTAAADVQRQGQEAYHQQNPIRSTAAQLAGGFLAMPEGAAAQVPTYPGDNSVITRLAQGKNAPVVPNQTAAIQQMTLKQINDAKNAAYQVVDNSPMKVSGKEIAALHTDLETKLARMGLNEDTMPALTPKLNTAMNSLEKAGTSDQTLQGLDIQRRIAGIAAGSTDKTERTAARIVQDGIDDFITKLQPSQLSGPIDQQAIDALPQARDLAQRSFKAQKLQDIIDKAGNNATGFSQSGYENSLRNGFRKLLNNDRAIARFSPDEVAAIKQVATGGNAFSATNLLRQVGKLSPQGAIPMLAELGGVARFGPTALAAPAAGIAGRAGATALQQAAAERALNLSLNGAPLAAAPRALSMPAITSASRIPYGLIPFGFPIIANQQAQ